MPDDDVQSSDYPQVIKKDPRSMNSKDLSLHQSQFPSGLNEALSDLNDVLINSNNQKYKQELSQFLTTANGNIKSPDELIPAIRLKLYGLLELWRP